MSLASSPPSDPSLRIINVGNPRTKKRRPQSWKQHEDHLRQLYSTTRLEDIQKLMITEHGFNATVAQYKYQFQKWHLNKYNTRSRASSSLESTPTSHSAVAAPDAEDRSDNNPTSIACTRRRISSVENRTPLPDAKRQKHCGNAGAADSEPTDGGLECRGLGDPSSLSRHSNADQPVIDMHARGDVLQHAEHPRSPRDSLELKFKYIKSRTLNREYHLRAAQLVTTISSIRKHKDCGAAAASHHYAGNLVAEVNSLERPPDHGMRSQADVSSVSSRDEVRTQTDGILDQIDGLIDQTDELLDQTGTKASSTDTERESSKKGSDLLAVDIEVTIDPSGEDRFDQSLRPSIHDVSPSACRRFDDSPGCEARRFLLEISMFARQAMDFETTIQASCEGIAHAPLFVDTVLIAPSQRPVEYTWPQLKRMVAAADLCFSLHLSHLAFSLYSAILRSPNCNDALGTICFTQVLMDWALSAQTPEQASHATEYIQECCSLNQSLGSGVVRLVLNDVLYYLTSRCQGADSGDRTFAISYVRAFRLKHFVPVKMDLIESSPAFSRFFQPDIVGAATLDSISTVSYTLCFRNVLRRCRQSLSTVQARAPVVTLEHSFEHDTDERIPASTPLELLLWIRDLGFNWSNARECDCIRTSEMGFCIWDQFSWAELLAIVCQMLYWIRRPTKQPGGRMHTSELLSAIDEAIRYSDNDLAWLIMKAIIEGNGYAQVTQEHSAFGDFVQDLIEQMLGIYMPRLREQHHSLSLRGRDSAVSHAPTIASSTHSSAYLSFRQTAQRLAESTPRSSHGLDLPSSMMTPSLLGRSSVMSVSELSDKFRRSLSISTGDDSESIRSGGRQSSLGSSQGIRPSRILGSLKSVRGIKA